MAQFSAPISQGSVSDRQLTDVIWRDRFGDEPGVLADMNGTSYAVTLPGSGDVASFGSTTQVSLATVAGFVHKIAAGSTESLTIPAASGSARTDIVALRYDPAFTGLPGPVRLVRIAGTTVDLPTYDATPGGIEDLPLWSITRNPGQNLSLATVKRLFPRIAPSLEISTVSPLPANSPLGTVVRQGAATFYRELSQAGVPVWAAEKLPNATGRAPFILPTVSTAADAPLTAVVTIPSVAVASRVTVIAAGRTGPAGSVDREVAWDFDSTPGTATNVAKDASDVASRVTARNGENTALVASLTMDLPANVAGTFRVVVRSSGPTYNRGAAIWTRGPVI